MEIRATSKIRQGQEITKNYILESYLDGRLKNFKERQKFLHERGFVCSCELCQEEEIDNDDETYKKFQNFKEEVEKIKDLGPFKLKFEHFEKMIACQKEMYNLAKNKKAPKILITIVLQSAFDCGFGGMHIPRRQFGLAIWELF